MSMRILAFLLLFCVWFPLTTWASTWVFVSEAGEQRIATFELDLETGELERVAHIELDGEPGALCSDPEHRWLLASLRSTGHLASFEIDADTGELSLINVVDAGADPAYVSTDRSGRYLLSAYYRAGKVSVHAISPSGELSSRPVQSIPTAEKAHAVVIDAANQIVWVPHTGPNAIHQFRFDSETGKLTPNEPPFVTTPDETGPRHLALHPGGKHCFVSNEQGGSVTAWRIGPDGTLVAQQTVSSLPPDFEEPNSCSHLELTPSGRFLYVANRGHDSLAGHEVDADTGHLTAQGWTPTEETPRSFAIDPSGRYLIAAGQTSGRLALYRIDGRTGELMRYADVDVGERPWWVQCLRTP